MALTSALFTGLSGLNANQTKLNVIGNNIANTNTTAFKSSRAEFASQFYLTDAGGSAPGAVSGGANPSQRGLGTQVSAIEKDMTQGSMETTGKDTDLAIDGAGFFIVEGAEGQQYTRAGDFTRNANNDLTTAAGQYVMGFGTDANDNVIRGKLQHLSIPTNLTSAAKATTTATMQGNFDAAGDPATGASVINSQALATVDATPITTATALTNVKDAGGTAPMYAVGDVLTLKGTKGGRSIEPPLTFTIDATSTVQNLTDFYDQGLQIKTDEPQLTGFNKPGAELDPATGVLTITGNAGKDNSVGITGTALTSSNPAMTMTFSEDPVKQAVGESVYTSMQVYDSLGNAVSVDVTATLTSKDTSGTTWSFIASSPDNTAAKTFDPTGTAPTSYYGSILGSGAMTFDNTGKYLTSTPTSLTLDRGGTGANAQQVVKLDFTTMTAMSTAASTLTPGKQDGYSSGTISDFSIGNDGTITGSFSNGQQRTLGQVAVATFDNPGGMTDLGGNVYSTGP
ncbi:MAG: flgE, partial [Phycisphaerales bacterium]|nr:flgE [Phycisphaerales bacterium]